ncbi:hypothetical protein KFK09_014694 [Dendrobium nobile]|uniref:Chromatin target of PRMT1 protein C-terminal domain-containing protein n=1 Tax=Dendrobium nobile TaxID=94219 RepID=A0A8T3B550_DENNO|nr:hypothetical protein KFK09_014694 [Dendrobium nobile]
MKVCCEQREMKRHLHVQKREMAAMSIFAPSPVEGDGSHDMRRRHIVDVTMERTSRWITREESGSHGGSCRWNRARGRGRGRSLGQSIDAGIARGRNLRNRGRGLGRGGTRGRGRGRGGKWLVRKTAEDLDKELETYHAGAMDTS